MSSAMNDKPDTDYTPSELILERSAAFTRGDFGFVFDSYHSESNFRRQFFEREEYLDYGQSSLAGEYQIDSCQILAEEVKADVAQVIFLVQMKVRGAAFRYAELAWLVREDAGWRYHRGQKINDEDLPEAPHLLTFSDFAKLDPETIF